MARTLETHIQIAAPVEKVWEVLTDFKSHSEWNPFIRSFSGKIEEGSTFSVTIQPPNGSGMVFKPTCLKLEKNQEFKWLGKLWVNGLFDGEHRFQLQELNSGHTLLRHSESFKGILVPLLWNSLKTNTINGFEMMNKALKARAEN